MENVTQLSFVITDSGGKVKKYIGVQYNGLSSCSKMYCECIYSCRYSHLVLTPMDPWSIRCQGTPWIKIFHGRIAPRPSRVFVPTPRPEVQPDLALPVVTMVRPATGTSRDVPLVVPPVTPSVEEFKLIFAALARLGARF